MHSKNNINLPIIGHSLHLSDNLEQLHSKINQYVFDVDIVTGKASKLKNDSYLALTENDDISISSIRYGIDSRVDFQHDDCLTLIIIFDGAHSTFHNQSNHIICDNVFFIPPKALVSADIAGDCANLIIRFKPTRLNLSIFKNLIKSPTPLPKDIQNSIQLAGHNYLNTYFYIDNMKDDCSVILNFKNTVYDIILRNESDRISEPISSHNISHDIVDFFKRNPKWEYNINDIIDYFCIAERTLYWQFKKETGSTPYRCYINIKLLRSRLDIMKFGGHKSITDIASQNGFTHLSRFSSQYRMLFGELPKQTIQRLVK